MTHAAMSSRFYLEAISLPIFEAWLAGLPVACSNVTALPEQVRDAALTFDPMSVEAIAGAVATMATDVDLQRDLQRLGHERIKVFTWERTAKAIAPCIGGPRASPSPRKIGGSFRGTGRRARRRHTLQCPGCPTPVAEQHGDESTMTWSNPPVVITLKGVRASHDEIKGDITITLGGSRVHWSSLALASTTAREGLVRKLVIQDPDVPSRRCDVRTYQTPVRLSRRGW
jgi:hypothetical protein